MPGRTRTVTKLYRRDGPHCKICGGELMSLQRYREVHQIILNKEEKKRTGKLDGKIKIPDNFPTLDHVTEAWRGGTRDIENLRLAHGSCNNERSNASGSNHHQFVEYRGRDKKINHRSMRNPLTYSLMSVWPKPIEN